MQPLSRQGARRLMGAIVVALGTLAQVTFAQEGPAPPTPSPVDLLMRARMEGNLELGSLPNGHSQPDPVRPSTGGGVSRFPTPQPGSRVGFWVDSPGCYLDGPAALSRPAARRGTAVRNAPAVRSAPTLPGRPVR